MAISEEEFKKIFIAEAIEQHEGINRLLTELEKDPNNEDITSEIFRLIHTMKGNAGGMGYEDIEGIAHEIESLFNGVRAGDLKLTFAHYNLLFKAVDFLEVLINCLLGDGKYNEKEFTSLIAQLGDATKGEFSDKSTTKSTQEEISTTLDTDVSLDSEEPVDEVEVNGELQQSDGKSNKVKFSDTIQVPVEKLDQLLNLVGELLIEKDKIVTYTEKHNLGGAIDIGSLHRITTELQYGVMRTRLIKIDVLFNKFYRIIRDVAHLEDKNVKLEIEGAEIEIDRNILQTISDSLIHLVRNSVGHGIETEDERKKANKPAQGVVKLTAKSEKDNVIIEVSDDGKGIDVNLIKKIALSKGLIDEAEAASMHESEILNCIFQPGFSTIDNVTEISGRGVGMDVVKKAIDSIGGGIEIITKKGEGTTFVLNIPSSLAVKGALLFELSNEVFAIPLSHTLSVESVEAELIHDVVGSERVMDYQGETIPVISLRELFGSKTEMENPDMDSLEENIKNSREEVIVVSSNSKKIGLVVDKLLLQKEIVEKPLEKPVDQVEFFSGVTIMGDGRCCLVLDVNSIGAHLFRTRKKATTEYA